MPGRARGSLLRRAAFLLAVAPSLARGQDGNGQAGAGGLRAELRNVFRFGDCAELVCLSLASPGEHGAHFNPAAQGVAETLVAFIGRAIRTSVTNAPLGATSSGTIYQIGRGGLPVPVAGSSGPIFGERAQTLGRGRLLVGANATGGSFRSLRGIPLDDLRLTLAHEDEAPLGTGNPTFERDTIGVQTSLNVSMAVASFYMTYGVSNRIDLGVVVPVARVAIDGTSTGTIVNLSGGALHFWSGTSANPQAVATARGQGSATGLGDMSLRAKFNLAQTPRAGVAFLTDVRLPTGDQDNLLGAGKMSARGLVVMSARVGTMTPHANVGFLWRDGVDQNSSLLGTVGFDALAARGLTLAADLWGEYQVASNRLTLPAPTRYVDGSLVRATTIPNRRDHQLSASVGAKYTLGGGLLGIANAILPLGDNGMRPNLFWTVGLERPF